MAEGLLVREGGGGNNPTPRDTLLATQERCRRGAGELQERHSFCGTSPLAARMHRGIQDSLRAIEICIHAHMHTIYVYIHTYLWMYIYTHIYIYIFIYIYIALLYIYLSLRAPRSSLIVWSGICSVWSEVCGLRSHWLLSFTTGASLYGAVYVVSGLGGVGCVKYVGSGVIGCCPSLWQLRCIERCGWCEACGGREVSEFRSRRLLFFTAAALLDRAVYM